MFSTLPIIQSYNQTAQILIQLASGQYDHVDNYYKVFHKRLQGTDDELRYLMGREWDIEDIQQEIFYIWHRNILKYYHLRGKRIRRKSYPLRDYLFDIGSMYLGMIINKMIQRLHSNYPPQEIVYDDREGLDLIYTDVSPKMLLRTPYFNTMSKLDLQKRLLLYRILHEDCRLVELMPEFGKDWNALRSFIKEIQDSLKSAK